MIRVTNLSKSYGEQELFLSESFTIHPKEKIAILGRNGYGKTTLFRILLDREQADSGEIVFPPHYSIGSLDQHIHFTQETMLAEACLGLPADQKADTWKAEKMLHGLGFAVEDFSRHPDEFSGGYQLRIDLVKTLLSEPRLLLLDEPTNYLDILSIRWLEKLLKHWSGELVLISHDEAFVDAICPNKLIIHRKHIRNMKGTVREVWEQIMKEEQVHEKTRQEQEKEVGRQEKFIRSFRAGARSAGLVQSRIKMLEKQETTEKLEKVVPIRFHFRYHEVHKPILVEGENLTFHYEEGRQLFHDLSLQIAKGDRIGIIGKNGQGKTTLLSVLAGKLPLQSGKLRLGKNTEIGYFGQSNVAALDPKKTILEELRSTIDGVSEQEIRTLCGSLLFHGEAVHKEIGVLSGGEKSRVSLGKIFLRPVNLLLLDEPTNHLDMESCDILLRSLQDFPGAVVFVSHNERLLREAANRLVIFEGGKAQLREMSYEDFLVQIGWAEEEKEEKDKGVQKGKKIHLERKEQQRRLRKVTKEIEETEKNITKKEESLREITTRFEQACTGKNPEQIEELARLLKSLQEMVDAEYETLEELMEEELSLG